MSRRDRHRAGRRHMLSTRVVSSGRPAGRHGSSGRPPSACRRAAVRTGRQGCDAADRRGVPCVRRCASAPGRSSGARAARPRAQRDFTVPSATPVIWATSATDRPCMSTRTRATRWASGSAARARLTSRRCSAAAASSPPAGRVELAQRGGRPGAAAADPVQAGVDDDPVQPGGDGGVAAEGVGPAEGGEQRLLDGVGRLLAVAEGAQGHRPQPVAVATDQLAERVRVPVDVGGEQLGVGRRRRPGHRRSSARLIAAPRRRPRPGSRH